MFTDKEEYENYSVERPSSKMTNATSTTSTQTFVPAKKIKPVKHPGLKLKTPIAYQKDSDLSVIPIAREGMGKNLSNIQPLSCMPFPAFAACLQTLFRFPGAETR
jgi:hypothetical protein